MSYEEYYKEGEELFREYKNYFQPVVILDSECKILYKNNASKFINIKPRVGTNIKKYMDSENIDKLYGAIKNDELSLLKLNTLMPVKYCFVQPESNFFTTLIFYDTLNLLNGDDIFGHIENILYQYNKNNKKQTQEKKFLKSTRDSVFLSEDNKKNLKMKDHFRKHIVNHNPNANNYPAYCDIGDFLNNFALNISPYINSLRCKIGFNGIENKMFYYMLNRNELLSINLILSAFALRYSIFNRIDIRFFSDFYAGISGILRYEFTVENDFTNKHSDMFVNDYSDNLKDMEYLDLNLAALIAKNNNLNLSVYSNTDKGGKVHLDLMFGTKKTAN